MSPGKEGGKVSALFTKAKNIREFSWISLNASFCSFL